MVVRKITVLVGEGLEKTTMEKWVDLQPTLIIKVKVGPKTIKCLFFQE